MAALEEVHCAQRVVSSVCAASILTYVGGSAAGVKLLKNDRHGRLFSIISLLVSVAILVFVGWSIAYVLAIAGLWFAYVRRSKC